MDTDAGRDDEASRLRTGRATRSPGQPSPSDSTALCVRQGIAHIGIVLLIAVALWIGARWSPRRALSVVLPTQTLSLTDMPTPNSVSATRPPPAAVSPTSTPVQAPTSVPIASQLFDSPVRASPADASRTGVITYTLCLGDSLASLAERFGLRRETIVWANAALTVDPNALYVGQTLIIPPVDGVYHVVEPGETLDQIADRYNVPIEAIANSRYNKREQLRDPLPAGMGLVVPGGVRSYRPHFVRFATGTIRRTVAEGTPSFQWPVRGEISQRYWDLHRAIDITGTDGDQVIAADAGTVVYASWDCSGYGNLVIVDHGNGYVTYYAHLYGFYVDVGQSVKRGDPLGVRGNTGRSTGPHLHFEIRRDGVQCDPVTYLPAEQGTTDDR